MEKQIGIQPSIRLKVFLTILLNLGIHHRCIRFLCIVLYSYLFILGTAGGTRTLTHRSAKQILSLSCLPIPPSGQMVKGMTKVARGGPHLTNGPQSLQRLPLDLPAIAAPFRPRPCSLAAGTRRSPGRGRRIPNGGHPTISMQPLRGSPPIGGPSQWANPQTPAPRRCASHWVHGRHRWPPHRPFCTDQTTTPSHRPPRRANEVDLPVTSGTIGSSARPGHPTGHPRHGDGQRKRRVAPRRAGAGHAIPST